MPSDRPGPHPEPLPDLASRALPLVDLAGPWFRVHQLHHDPLYFGRSADGRFNSPSAEYGVLYAGSDPHCAFIETFGQSTGVFTVTLAALVGRGLSRIKSRRLLRLVDLTGQGLARLGADERLCSGEHEVAQRLRPFQPICVKGSLSNAYMQDQAPLSRVNDASSRSPSERTGGS